MTLPSHQRATCWLAFLAVAALIAGCGGSRPLSPEAQVLAFANAVNLRTGGNLPESRWMCRDPCAANPPRVTRSEHVAALGCEARHAGASDVLSVNSAPLHLKRNENRRASSADPEAEVSSIVYVLPSVTLARQELAAAHECVKRELLNPPDEIPRTRSARTPRSPSHIPSRPECRRAAPPLQIPRTPRGLHFAPGVRR